MKFKAAILECLNKPLIVDQIEINQPLSYGQVLVRISVAGICGAQINEITGAYGEDKYLPHLLGHEGSGDIVECGPGVTQVKVGDTVCMHWRKGAGMESQPPKYKWGGKTVGAGRITTFSDYAIVSENRLTVIDPYVTLPLEIIALMGCAITTGLGIINNEANLKIGQSIAVIGCGGVGLNIIQGADLVSAGSIAAIDINNKKLKYAYQFGATDVYDAKNCLPDRTYDVVAECTGNPNMIDIGLSLTAPGGKMILVGQPRAGENVIIKDMQSHYCNKTILDSQGGLTDPNVDIPKYLKLYSRGRLKLDKLITHRYQLDDINQAIKTVRTGDASRCILKMF